MGSLRLALVLSLLTLVACSDDALESPAGSPGSGGSGASGGAGGGGAGAQGGGGGMAPAACDEVGVDDLDGGSWDARFTVAGLSGHDGIAPAVHDFALEPDGSVIAAGRFEWFEGEAVEPLMRWKGGVWQPARSSWEIEPPRDGFSAVAVSTSGDLALATNDTFGERDGEIWLDQGAGLSSIASFTGQVRSLAWFDGLLWVAGLFELDGPAPVVSGLATWDGSSWSAPPGGALEGFAFELFVDGGTLFVGGAFTGVGGIPADHVASYDGASWSSFDFPDALVIYALARNDAGDLYAGGAYGDFFTASGVARWDGLAWQTVGGGLGQYMTRGVVTDLVAHGNVVDATGCFTSAGGLLGDPGAIASRSVARWDGGAWQALDDDTQGSLAPWYQPMVCGDEGLTAIWDVSYQRLAHDGQQLFAGGWFSGITGVQSQALAAHDGSGWVAQGSAGLGFGGSLDWLAAGGDRCELYGMGMFSHAAGELTEAQVVHFDGAGWTPLADPLPKDAFCPAIDVGPEGQVAVGCTVFPPDFGEPEGAILRRQGDALVQLPARGLPPVMALDWSSDGVLWIAGGGATGYLARLEGDALTMVEGGFDAMVSAIDVASESDIVATGVFTKVGGVDALRIARWDGNAWTPLGDGLPAQPSALARDATTIYASTYDEGSGAYLLGAFDGDAWQELARREAGVTPVSHFNLNGIHPIDGGLVVSGSVELDDGSARGVLVYRDGVFRGVAGGVGAVTVGNVAVSGGALWAAGWIAQAGSADAPVSSVGVARYQLGR